MKKTIIILLMLFLALFSCKDSNKTKNQLKGTISISGAWALYPMAVKWTEEFQKAYPDIKVDISAGGAGKGMADVLSNVVDIAMVSREIYDEEVKKGAFGFSVCKDAVVPIVNENNPQIKEILAKGISKDIFKRIFIDENIKFWSEITKVKNISEIHAYTRSDSCGAAETWAKYLDVKQENLKGTGVYSDPGIVEAVKNDKLGIGYCNIGYGFDSETNLPVKGILLVPIDLNLDNKISDDENFYQTKNDLTSAINNNLYPSPPARALNFVTLNKPKNKLIILYLKWVLNEGQNYIEETGYIKLPEELIKNEKSKL